MFGLELPITASVLIIIIALISSSFTLGIGPFRLKVESKKDVKDLVTKIKTICELHINEQVSIRNNVLKNQIQFAESILHDVCQSAGATREVYDMLHANTKARLKENGINKLGPSQFSSYIGIRIDECRQTLSKYVESPYITTPDFSDKVASLWQHALDTYTYWNNELVHLEDSYKESIKTLIKGAN